MAKITVAPATYELVDFDAGEIQQVAEEMAGLVGLGDDVEVDLEVDEAAMVARVDSTVEGNRIELKVSGGAFEDQRRARQFDRERARTVLGTYLLRGKDRLDPGFADAPDNADLTVQQSVAWDTYTEGRLARLGVNTRQPRRLYHFRLRHGFSDDIDAVFQRLWNAEGLQWADIQSACDETAKLKAALQPA